MFIIEKELSLEGKLLTRVIKKKMGFVPKHFELFASLNPARLKMYLQELEYISTHKNIEPDFFTFIRLAVASKEGFEYCINLNRQILLTRGYTKEQLGALLKQNELPLNSKHKALFVATLDAMRKAESFTKESVDSLLNLGWSYEDIWDALDHGAFLYKYAKILEAFLTKE